MHFHELLRRPTHSDLQDFHLRVFMFDYTIYIISSSYNALIKNANASLHPFSCINSLHSSSDGNAPYEDFHEKYISYKHEPFRIRSVSFEEQTDTIIRDEMPSLRYARLLYILRNKLSHNLIRTVSTK